MAKLVYYFVNFVFISVLSLAVSEENNNESESESKAILKVEVVNITNWPNCDKRLEFSDIGIFDADIWYQVGNRKENSLSEGEEKLPYTIELGKNKLLEVLEKELIGMCLGDHRRITVPPHLAYGNETIEFPDGRELSGGATLITEFKLIQIVRRTEEEKKKNFQLLDADGDDKIDQDEIQAIIDLYTKVVDKEGAEETKEIMSAIFKRVDKDGDGSITIEEFYSGDLTVVDDESGKQFMTKLMKTFIQNQPKPPQQDAPCPACPVKKKCQEPPPTCQTPPTCSSCTPSAQKSTVKSTTDAVKDRVRNTTDKIGNDTKMNIDTVSENEMKEIKRDSTNGNHKQKDEL